MAVANIFCDVVYLGNSSSRDNSSKSLVLYDITFNQLFEVFAPRSDTSKQEPKQDGRDQPTPKTRYTKDERTKSYGVLKEILKSDKWAQEAVRTVSSYELYLNMSKMVKLKYRKSSNAEPRTIFRKVLALIERYIKFLSKPSACKTCQKIIIFNPKTGNLEFPLLAFNVCFYHSICCPEGILQLIS